MRGNPRESSEEYVEEYKKDEFEKEENEEEFDFHPVQKRVEKQKNNSVLTLIFSGAIILFIVVFISSIFIYNNSDTPTKQADKHTSKFHSTKSISTKQKDTSSVKEKESTKKNSSSKKSAAKVEKESKSEPFITKPSTQPSSEESISSNQTDYNDEYNYSDNVSNDADDVITTQQEANQSVENGNAENTVIANTAPSSSTTQSSSTTYKEIKLDEYIGKDARDVTKLLTAQGATVEWKEGNKAGAKKYEILEVLGEGSKATLTIQN